ncbi:hypothetical protein [Paenibacillus mucilaginosus]|uniref:hypothetical protein n=1 Tax=Paenibacillus mucilaginosus TaxID=61624 RepID=UPI000308909F|nr:hypothetical protein [Paenibacillus mucilaginosus]
MPIAFPLCRAGYPAAGSLVRLLPGQTAAAQEGGRAALPAGERTGYPLFVSCPPA